MPTFDVTSEVDLQEVRNAVDQAQREIQNRFDFKGTDSSVELFGLGAVNRQIIEASDGWVLISRLSDTAAIGVVASLHADLGLIGYEMTRLTRQLGPMLSPAVVDKLKGTLAS